MEIRTSRHVLAPNVWSRGAEVCDATVRLDGPPTADLLATAIVRIDAALPMRRELFGGVPPAVAAAGDVGTAAWPRLLGQVALTLQSRARLPVTTFLAVTEEAPPDLFRIVLEAHDPALVDACLRAAATILEQARTGIVADLTDTFEQLESLADDVCIGAGTMLIVRAAAGRGIPWRRLGFESLVQFGQGIRQRRIWTAVTDRTSSIAEGIAVNKQLTKDMLAAAGVPVPLGRVVGSAAEAWEAAQAVGVPVVVKPLDANHGRGVFLNLSTREEIEGAFPVASSQNRRETNVIVEQYVPGVEHRLLVVGGRMVACAKGEHIYVTGDGRHTIAELIALQINSDPRRGRSDTMPNKTVDLDATVLAQLAQEGMAPESIPADGHRVLVRQIGTHGLDVTQTVHPDMAAVAVRAARTVGLDIAGIDLIARDIGQPPEPQGSKVCEVNAGPQLVIHARPSHGPGQPVGEAIVDLLVATAAPGRIPVAAFLTAHPPAAGPVASRGPILLERLLRSAGMTPGLTCAAGRWVGGRLCSTQRCDSTDAARDLVIAPDIDAAVCELEWRSLATRGFPFDRLDVLVLGMASSGPSYTPPAAVDAVVAALVETVADSGTIVLAAAGGVASELSARSGRRVIVVGPQSPPSGAAARGCVTVRDGTVLLEQDDSSTPLFNVDGSADPNGLRPVLEATAAAIALGMSAAAVQRGMPTALTDDVGPSRS